MTVLFKANNLVMLKSSPTPRHNIETVIWCLTYYVPLESLGTVIRNQYIWFNYIKTLGCFVHVDTLGRYKLC